MYKCNMALCAYACVLVYSCVRCSCLCRIAVMERVWHVTQQRTTKYITHLHKYQKVLHALETANPRKYHSVILCTLSLLSHCCFFFCSMWLYLLLLHTAHMIRCDSMPCHPCQQFNVIEIIVSVHSFGYSFFSLSFFCVMIVGRISLVHSQLLSLAIYIFIHQIIFSLQQYFVLHS